MTKFSYSRSAIPSMRILLLNGVEIYRDEHREIRPPKRYWPARAWTRSC